MAGKRGLFRPARHKWLADIVCIKTPSCARKAATKLLRLFKQALRAGKRDRAVLIKRAVVLAANRARVSAKRRSLSVKERAELKEVARIYERAADMMVLPPKRR